MLTSALFKDFSTPLERAYLVSYSSVIGMSASKCFQKGEKPLCLYRTKGTYGDSWLPKRVLTSFLLPISRASMASYSMLMLIIAWKCMEICEKLKIKVALYYKHADVSEFQNFFYAIGKSICGSLFKCNTNVVLQMLRTGWKDRVPLEDKLHIWWNCAWDVPFDQFFSSIR